MMRPGARIEGAVETAAIITREGTFTASVAGRVGAPLVILLHGFPHTRHTWRDMLPAVASAGFRVIAPDQRGYSAGARPLEITAYATDRLVRDVIEIAEVSGSDSFHVVGHDWGGQLAWLLAAHHPEHVASLTSLSRPHPAAFARSLQLDPEQRARSSHHQRFLATDAADELAADGFRNLRAGLMVNGVSVADIDAYIAVLGERSALDAALNWYRAAGGEGLGALDCPDVAAPTLYLWGERDGSVGRTAAHLSADHAAGPYRFIELSQHGHFLMDDGAGPAVIEAVLDHLQSA